MSWYSRFRVAGLTLSSVDRRLSQIRSSLSPSLRVTSSYNPYEACVDVYLLSHDPNDGSNLDEDRLFKLSQQIEHSLGAHDFVFHSRHVARSRSPSPSIVEDDSERRPATLAQAVYDLLSHRNLTLALAESLTGGLMASALTDVPGMSSYLLGGCVTYTIASKHALGVPPHIISSYGVVSRQTAEAMATAAKNFFAADIGVGITGVAGPDRHGDEEVGTVFIGVHGPDGTSVEEGGELCLERVRRKEIKAAAVAAALNILRRELKRTDEKQAVPST